MKTKPIRTLILASFITSFMAFIYFIIKDHGFFLLVDDFNLQQIPFAAAIWDVFRGGKWGEWTWSVDLGFSVIGGYGFYNLGSPFMWLSFLFPKGDYPYIVAWLTILKYIVASVTAYFYLERFVSKNKIFAIIGALLYAFSGFQTTNLEFHFHDAVAFFPLLLIGAEELLEKSKYKLFIFSIFLNCIVNYLFFVEEVVFLIIYFLFRVRKDNLSNVFKKGISCILCGACGVSMASFLFLPNVLYLLENPRTDVKMSFLYSLKEIAYFIKGIILPGDSMKTQIAFWTSEWDSASCYIPFIGISLVIAYIIKKRDWLTGVILTLTVFSFSPFLSSSFLLFTMDYKRWWFMYCMVMILASVIVLDNAGEFNIKLGLIINIVVIVVYVAALCVCNLGEQLIFHYDRLFLFAFISLIGPVILLIFASRYSLDSRFVLVFTMLFCALTTGITLHYYESECAEPSYKADYYAALKFDTINPQYRYANGFNYFTLPGDANSITTFSSTISNSSREFDLLFSEYSTNQSLFRFENGVGQLLGAKYVITNGADEYVDKVESEGREYYVSEYPACPIGFGIENIISKEELMKIDVDNRAKVLMSSAVIDTDDIGGTLWEDVEDDILKTAKWIEEDNIDCSVDLYESIDKTVNMGVGNFYRDAKGFSCTSNYSQDKLVYFSVPYDKGWKASVDGIDTPVIKSGGMMLIRVPKGTHTIMFKYNCPGFRIGLVLSCIGFILFISFVIYDSVTHSERRKLNCSVKTTGEAIR